MISGVYQLTFTNGQRYIGKSINIENRYQQHLEKMQKGTAAKNMQQAYNMYGAPEGEVICYAHSDHIDILEAAYIARHQPELNSDRPKDPFPKDIDVMWYLNHTNVFKSSTVSHITDLVKLLETNNSLAAEVRELESLNDDLLRKRKLEELQTVAGVRAEKLERENNYLNTIISNLKSDMKYQAAEITYLRKPWWKKIFS